ncbi:MAG: hypothetical protein V3U16_08310 [Candidatus Neomarinimicrobiota bacterium]
MRRIISILAIILFVIMNSISGEPRFAVQNGTSCGLCHLNPTGGDLRSDYGISIVSLDELPADKSFTSNYSGIINEFITFGADFRIQSLIQKEEFEETEKISVVLFPMQLDIYGQISVLNNLAMYIKHDHLRNNQEFWAIFTFSDGNNAIRVGKMMPDYGIKLADHTAFTRGGNIRQKVGLEKEGLLFSPTRIIPAGIEGSFNYNDLVFSAGLYNRFLDGSDQNYGENESILEKTVSAKLQYFHDGEKVRKMVGLSYLKEGNISFGGIFGGLNYGKWTWMGELDLSKNWIPTSTSLASFSSLSFNIKKGWVAEGRYDFFDENIEKTGKAISRFVLGLSIFPIPFVELKFQARITSVAEGSPTDPLFLIQIHTWL